MTKRLIAIVLLCLLGMSGQVLIKKGLTRIGGFDVRHAFASFGRLVTDSHILLAVACLGAAFLLYLTILSRSQLSALYPIAVGLNFVILGALSALFLNEPLSGVKILGLALILSGISCFAFSKSGI